MEYQERLAARKREFGRTFPPLTQTDKSAETTIPAPMGWNYNRSYQPVMECNIDSRPLPCEKPFKKTLPQRYEY
jgi:hypothetical protein